MNKYKVGDKVLLEGKINKTTYGLDFLVDVDIDGKNIIIEEDKIISKTYEDGLNDAWKLMDKLAFQVIKDKREQIFGYREFEDILDHFTPQEAFAKIEVYEKSQQIQVGDVVRRISDKKEYLIITRECDDYMFKYGVIELKTMTTNRITGSLSHFEKTGRHIDISQILDEIRG